MIHRKVTIHFQDKTVTIYSINQHVESCGPVVRSAIKPECRVHFAGSNFHQEIAHLDSPEAASNCAASMNENITRALERMADMPPDNDTLIVFNLSPPFGESMLREMLHMTREKELFERVQRDILNLHLPDEPITCDNPSLVDQQVARSTITGEVPACEPPIIDHSSYDSLNPPTRRYLWDGSTPARHSDLFDRHGLDIIMGRRQFRHAAITISGRLSLAPGFCINLRNSLRALLVTALEGIIETEYVAGFPAPPGTDPIGAALLGHIWSEFSDVRDPALISGMRSALMAANMTAQRDVEPSCIENVRRLGLRAEELQEICEAINAARGDEPSGFSGMSESERDRIEIIYRDCFCNHREEVRDAARACVSLSAAINSLTSPIGRKGSEALVKAIHQMASMLP